MRTLRLVPAALLVLALVPAASAIPRLAGTQACVTDDSTGAHCFGSLKIGSCTGLVVLVNDPGQCNGENGGDGCPSAVLVLSPDSCNGDP
jgi:hypothetical protein